MIKYDVLREFRSQVRYQDGADITLTIVQGAIKKCARDMNIPVAFKKDQVKSGGMLNKNVEDCIVMYHPDHEKDYLKFCIRVTKQGNYAFVSINDFGSSKQLDKQARTDFAKADRQGKQRSYKVGSMIGSGIRNLGKNKAKVEVENMYYQCIFDIFDEIVA